MILLALALADLVLVLGLGSCGSGVWVGLDGVEPQTGLSSEWRARRDEDFDLGSRMLAMVGCESDDFLGQCLLPLSTLSGESELWCNLGEPATPP